jgi:hypothetical protein
MGDLYAIARQLGGEVAGPFQILCPGPGHSSRDRSLSVRFDPRAPAGLLVFSHAGDDPLAAKDYVRARLGRSVDAPKAGPRHDAARAAPEPDDAERTARALALWQAAQPPASTIVDTYLTGRGLALPERAGAVLRYHPACPFADSRTPAMLALVRDVQTNRPIALHRTALDDKGSKRKVAGYSRLSLGPVGGGAIKLTADEAVTTCLGIAEGVETALSLQLLPEFRSSPVWALISASGIAAFPVLPGIETLWIAVDHDPTGIAAAKRCAERWDAAGREVLMVQATAPGVDINDILNGAPE